MNCNNCGSALEAGWRFCRDCGREVSAPVAPWAAVPPTAPLATVAPAGPPPGPAPAPPAWGVAPFPDEGVPTTAVRAPAKPRRRWFPLAAIAAAFVALAGGLAYTIANDVQTHNTLHTTQATLGSTTKTLHSTQKDLAGTRSTLATAQNDLSSTKTQLSSTQQELAGVKQTVSQNNTEINNLGTCLTGVLTALDIGANGDFAGEQAELQKIEPNCRQGLANLP